MKQAPKWLLIPPAVALLLILGPMSMSGGDQSGTNPASQPGNSQPAQPTNPVSSNGPAASNSSDPAAGTLKQRAVPGSLVPRTPDMWKMASAMVGVLLLGAGALVVVKRMRGGATPQGKTALATLRQTVRLTAKQSLHAIEFDNRILLIGESEKGLSLIDRGSLPEAADDEATVLARQQLEQEEDDDDGAVPRNLLIPRPAAKPNAPRKQAQPAQAATPSKADVAIAKLNDFRTLLEKAGR